MSLIKNTRGNRNINKIIYITMLMAILFGILFYLDMLSYFSLENIVSVILGFLILIIVQLRFISYYYEDKMKELDLDEVGVVKNILKTNIFGQINSNYIAKKQKMKYYTQTKDQNDRLFSDQNRQTFQCVMYANISKNYADNDRKIKKRIKLLKEKWELFIARVDLFQSFLRNLLKLHKDRSLSFKKFHEKVSVLRNQDYQNWEVLFSGGSDALLKEREHIQDIQQFPGRNWLQFKRVLFLKQQNLESVIKQLNGVVNEFNGFANQMRAQIRLVFTEVQSIQTESAAAWKNYREVDDKIKASNSKIESLYKKISSKRKQAADMELIFNTEYDIKFLRIELSNLQVQQTYLKDMVQKNLQIQYKHCIRKQNFLEESGIKKFQNKISHYSLTYFDKLKFFQSKKQFTELNFEQQRKNVDQLLVQNFPSDMIKKVSENLNQIQRRQAQFKNYLKDVRLLSDDELRNLKKINDSIQDYNKQWKRKVQLKNLHQMSAYEIAVDIMVLTYMESVNKKYVEIISKEVTLIDDQLHLINTKELNKKNVVFKKSSQKTKEALLGANSVSHNNLNDIMQFQIENRIPSCLQQILLCFVSGYDKIKKEIDEKQTSIKQNTKAQITFQNPQTSRMNQYNEYQPFKQEDFDNNDSKQQDDNSLALVNRILDVFAAQWCNSENFHQILKEEIEVSLNTKRPPVLNYMSVKYIKLHRKQKETIENLTVLNDNIFICNFEIMIKFKGQIAVHIQTRIKNQNIPINIRLIITEFECPLRICFTPFCLGKSNMCMMKTPKLTLDYNVNINGWQITKIPFLSLFIQMFIVVKLRKKFLYPKKATMKVPMAVKNALSEAIKERVNYEKLQEKKKKTQ